MVFKVGFIEERVVGVRYFLRIILASLPRESVINLVAKRTIRDNKMKYLLRSLNMAIYTSESFFVDEAYFIGREADYRPILVV